MSATYKTVICKKSAICLAVMFTFISVKTLAIEESLDINISKNADKVSILYDKVDGGNFLVETVKDPNSRLAAFNKSASKFGTGGKFTNCSMLIDIEVGANNGNHTYGGYCTLVKAGIKRNVEVCNDDMTGIFVIGYSPVLEDQATKPNLISFAAASCFGG